MGRFVSSCHVLAVDGDYQNDTKFESRLLGAHFSICITEGLDFIHKRQIFIKILQNLIIFKFNFSYIFFELIISVCKAWKQAAISKEFHTLIYDEYPEKNKSYADKEKLNYKEFLEILQFVAPKIKQTKFERMDHGDKNVDVLVAFGKFDYALEVNYKERQYLTNVFVQQTECIEKLKLSSFDGATKREWARFFQTNPLKSFKFFSANYREQSTFYHDYVCFLPESLEKIEFYWPNYYDEEECFYFSFDKILQVCRNKIF